MKKYVLLLATALWLFSDANAFDIRLLENNKEIISRELSTANIQSMMNWQKNHPLSMNLKSRSINVLDQAFDEMEQLESSCEIGLMQRLIKIAKEKNLIEESNEIFHLLVFYRQQNLIDDIFYKILKNSAKIDYDFNRLNELSSPRPINLLTRQNSQIDLNIFYNPFKSWPNEIKNCSTTAFENMFSSLNWKNTRDLDNQIIKLNFLALRNKVISLETFKKLEVLRKIKIKNQTIALDHYLKIINEAKDKLTKSPEIITENSFPTNYVSRRDGITQRENLYLKYTSTEVVILAQIIEKASKRIDAKYASLSWKYSEDEEIDIYVLSPMEQYRAAIKMLRRDMAETMRSEAFQNKNVQYEDLIAAAYETGLIKSSELNHVLKFEELWNPKTPKWKAYMNFAFSLGGTATFFLPPPWNVVGAIGLALTQSKIANGQTKPDSDDNWNVIF